MSQQRLTTDEVGLLQDTLSADTKHCSIRLREGELQYSLAKTIATLELDMYYPDVKDLTRMIYGEEKTKDIQTVRKLQTILKKMEKSDIVKILSKRKPWELQRYAVTSFRFQDADNNFVLLATEEKVNQAKSKLNSVINQQDATISKAKKKSLAAVSIALSLLVALSYATIVWDVLQPIVSWIIFIPAFAIAMAGSLALGKTLSRE